MNKGIGSWIPDTVDAGASEWGLKAVAMVGAWIVGPVSGEIAPSDLWSLTVLTGLTVALVAFNKLYDDFLYPLSPRANLESTSEVRNTEDGDAVENDDLEVEVEGQID